MAWRESVRYMLLSPRGFADEFMVYRVLPADFDAAEDLLESYADNPNGGARWLSVQEAHYWAARARRLARLSGKAEHPKFTYPFTTTGISDWRPDVADAET